MNNNPYNNENWVLRPEIVASGIIGEDIVLGTDICVYFKMAGYSQKVFDRIAKTPNYSLADEIKTDSGYVMLGDAEKIRAQMHEWVNNFIDGAKNVSK